MKLLNHRLKYIILLVFGIILYFNALPQKVTIKIKNLDKKEIYIENKNGKKDTIFQTKKNTYIIDKQLLTKPESITKAILTFPVKSIKRYYPEPKLKDYEMQYDCTKIELFLYPDCEINIEAIINFEEKIIEYTLTENGAEKYNESMQYFNSRFYKIEAQQISIVMKMLNRMNEMGLSVLNKDDVAKTNEIDEFVAMNKENAVIVTEMQNLIFDLFKTKQETYLPVLLLHKYKSQFGSLEETEKMLHELPDFQQNCFFGKQLQKYYDGFKNTQQGELAAEFSATTFDNKEFKLSALKGKYVILDFWGSWCRPCVAGLPALKEFYEKYKDKLEVVGVASDKEDVWKNFLTAKPQYNWVQILDASNTIMSDYGVTAFPTKFLLGTQGEILLKEVGESPSFLENVEKYLNGEIK